MIGDPTYTRLGRYVETSIGGEIVCAFVPPALPRDPAINFLSLLTIHSAAERALGLLDGDHDASAAQ